MQCPTVRCWVQTVFACVYDPTAQRLRQPGMEFAVWIFKHAEAAPLQAAAPPLLRGLLHLLDDGAIQSTNSMPVSDLIYWIWLALVQMNVPAQ